MKRRKFEDEKKEQDLVMQDCNNSQPRGSAHYIDISKLDPNEINTPMMNALSMRFLGHDNTV